MTEFSQLDLEEKARFLMREGKGILAADESGGSIHKKFLAMKITDDAKHRRDYRNLFFTTPDLEKYVNGVILFDETARQYADNGKNFAEFLSDKGIMPGIKVDMGLAKFPQSQEKYTLGLNGLDRRLEDYAEMGLGFAKWRAAFEVDRFTPSMMAIQTNASILAKYAQACQRFNIVPIVEPELVYDGDYTLIRGAGLTGIILKELFIALEEAKVNLAGTILKVNMVLNGKKSVKVASSQEVGLMTAQVLKTYVPAELAGVVFLSGGQTPEQVTDNLRAIKQHGPFAWPLTFSFARALQGPALEAWRGDNKNIPQAQAAFLERLKANCAALNG